MRVWHLSGLKKMLMMLFYKHIVPTGLKRGQNKRKTVKSPVYVKQCLTIGYLAQLVFIDLLYVYPLTIDSFIMPVDS